MPLHAMVNSAFGSTASGYSGRRLVGISFDDGPIFDFQDFVHPEFGPQRSFYNILRDFIRSYGADAQPSLHATSFVIASRSARKAMEQSPDCGFAYLNGWVSDAWWKQACESNLMAIENHSWDHVHHAVQTVPRNARDNFAAIDTFCDADNEIRKANDFISAVTGRSPSLFAFPFGHTNRYLIEDYLPNAAQSVGLAGAFTTAGKPFLSGDRWAIPRFVCGFHWRTEDELRSILSADF